MCGRSPCPSPPGRLLSVASRGVMKAPDVQKPLEKVQAKVLKVSSAKWPGLGKGFGWRFKAVYQL